MVQSDLSVDEVGEGESSSDEGEAPDLVGNYPVDEAAEPECWSENDGEEIQQPSQGIVLGSRPSQGRLPKITKSQRGEDTPQCKRQTPCNLG